ncbi:MAG: dihydroorotase [Bacteroidales bacterium]
MAGYLIKNARIVNEGKIFTGHVVIRNGLISEVVRASANQFVPDSSGLEQIDADGKLLLPGVIDDQVHFREPGLTHKADIATESRAAVAGGVTSFMEMPNTVPNTLTQQILEEKYQLASKKSAANYSFYMGASNDNIDEILKTDHRNVCGVKVFMGASTGNMLVDDINALNLIFSRSKMLVAVHSEDEPTIQANLELFKEKYGTNIPVEAHPLIRSEEACYRSSSLAVKLAHIYKTRLHLLHLSTEKEMSLLDNSKPLRQKKITAEVCVHHLWFEQSDYQRLGTRIKWNPAIKTSRDRDALLKALLAGKIDVVATDHAPHTPDEKNRDYLHAPSGGPLVQHSLPAMLEMVHQGKISLTQVVDKMCHAPAICFRVENRGFIRPGFFADLVLVDPARPVTVDSENILYKCGWSPFEGVTFSHSVTHTFVNGNPVFENGKINDEFHGQRLTFRT